MKHELAGPPIEERTLDKGWQTGLAPLVRSSKPSGLVQEKQVQAAQDGEAEADPF
jgi:hypothetical protein